MFFHLLRYFVCLFYFSKYDFSLNDLQFLIICSSLYLKFPVPLNTKSLLLRGDLRVRIYV